MSGVLQTDAEKPVPDTQVGVAGGPSNTTDSKGQFSLRLSLDFIEGERVILVVQKKDWVINSPLDGEWNLPNIKLQNVQYTKVIIVPKGSKALWTHARIEKHIVLLSDELATLKKEGDKPEPINLSYYLGEWANKYGFTPDQVRAAFDQWYTATEKSDNHRRKALREFYRQNFFLAAQYFVAAARENSAHLKAIREAQRQETLQAYANWKDAGNSLSNLYRFEAALAMYDSAKSYVPKENYLKEWAEVEILIGSMKVEIGSRVQGEKALALLKEAEQIYRQALEGYTREQLPQEWARTQNNLGIVLNEQGFRITRVEAVAVLAQAISAFHAALELRTRETMPQEWAATQSNLGIALYWQAILTGDAEVDKLLAQAVIAYRAALEVYDRKTQPQDWAMMQDHLGIALQELGARTDGAEGDELLAQAVAAHHAALDLRTRDTVPQDWAATQNNLGIALQKLGHRTGGAEGRALLAQAVAAYRAALDIRTRDTLPQDWARTQNNLGVVLKELGLRTSGAEGAALLAQAVAAYRAALEVYIRNTLPQGWAMVQNNLGEALLAQDKYGEAAVCFENVLRENPDNQNAYDELAFILHENLYEYSRAFALNRNWLDRHPEDLSAQSGFAENHFTTGRFAECEKRIAVLLANPDIGYGVKIALRTIEIANLLTLNKAGEIPSKLDTLHAAIASQPEEFKVDWSFEGTRHFISQNEKLASHRKWLQQLFNAMEGEDRKAILDALKAVKANF